MTETCRRLLFLIFPLLLSRNPGAGENFIVSARKEYTREMTASRDEYDISVHGTADMENTMIRRHHTIEIGFQNNISLEVENIGEHAISDPKIIANGRGDWGSAEGILEEALRGARDDQEKLACLWQWMCENRYHELPLFAKTDSFDPVKYYCCYGQGWCGQQAFMAAQLAWRAGFAPPRVKKPPAIRWLNGHVQGEIFLARDYQFWDSDQEAFYLLRDNETPASGDDVARDRDLASRELHDGPFFKGWKHSRKRATLFGDDDRKTFERKKPVHRISWTLRPGEKIIYRWDNIGKYTTGYPKEKRNEPPRFFGNSKAVYQPRFHLKDCLPYQMKNCVFFKDPDGNTCIRGTKKDSCVVFHVKTPLVMCGGRINAKCLSHSGKDRVILSFSEDEKNWYTLDEGKNPPGKIVLTGSLDPFFHRRPFEGKGALEYFIRIDLSSGNSEGGVDLRSIRFETDLMASPLYLPRLVTGQNRVKYTDRTSHPHRIRVTHRWIESDNVRPLQPPEILAPLEGEVISETIPEFRWGDHPRAPYHQIQVSRRPDFRIPFRTAFHTIITSNTYRARFPGMFSSGDPYYFRVRYLGKEGIWGEWTTGVKFLWNGPHPPVGLELKNAGERFILSWKPNPRGTRPVSYEIHGSNEKGFSIPPPGEIKDAVSCIGITKTTHISMGDETHPSPCFHFYRVVAVDENETKSGPSDYVRIPEYLKKNGGIE